MADTDSKRCPKCGDTKELSLFKVRKSAPSGRSSWCKQCDSNQGRTSYATNPERKQQVWANSLRQLYGMTVAEYQEMFVDQDGACAICGKEEDWRLCVDHDHETGAVRQLLCRSCNVQVGVVENHYDRIRAYLDRHEGATPPIRAVG